MTANRFISTSVLVLSFSLGGCGGLLTRGNPDLAALQGHWEGRGPGGPCTITISGNLLDFKARDDFWFDTEFTLASDEASKQIHATILADSDANDTTVGQTVVAVFEIDGEELNIGVLEDFDEPPEGLVEGGWDDARDRYYLTKAELP